MNAKIIFAGKNVSRVDRCGESWMNRVWTIFFSHNTALRFSIFRRSSLRNPARVACETRNSCVVPFARWHSAVRRSTKKGTRRWVQLLFRQRLRQCAWECKSLSKNALNFDALCTDVSLRESTVRNGYEISALRYTNALRTVTQNKALKYL